MAMAGGLIRFDAGGLLRGGKFGVSAYSSWSSRSCMPLRRRSKSFHEASSRWRTSLTHWSSYRPELGHCLQKFDHGRGRGCRGEEFEGVQYGRAAGWEARSRLMLAISMVFVCERKWYSTVDILKMALRN